MTSPVDGKDGQKLSKIEFVTDKDLETMEGFLVAAPAKWGVPIVPHVTAKCSRCNEDVYISKRLEPALSNPKLKVVCLAPCLLDIYAEKDSEADLTNSANRERVSADFLRMIVSLHCTIRVADNGNTNNS